MGNESQATSEPSRAPAVMTVALLIGALCAIYVVSQFLRNSVGVIAPDLAAELDLAPQALGMLSSAFFLAFAAAQVPLGVAIDRYGPKTCMLASIGLAVLGCAVFAWAETVTGLTLGRILMGLGCSSFLMGPLAIYTRWFRPEQFSTLAGVMLGVGTIGTLFATAPLAVSAELYGWRTTFLFVGAGAAVVGLLVLAIVRDDPPGVVRPVDRSAGLVATETERISSAIPTVQRLGFALGAAYIGIVANAAGFAESAERSTLLTVASAVFIASLPLAGLGLVATGRFVSARKHASRVGVGCG